MPSPGATHTSYNNPQYYIRNIYRQIDKVDCEFVEVLRCNHFQSEDKNVRCKFTKMHSMIHRYLASFIIWKTESSDKNKNQNTAIQDQQYIRCMQ